MKKRTNISEQNVQRWISQGYGQGHGQSYRPFFHVRDVPSRGRSCMVQGLKTGRIHHYLSDLEYGCHLLAEYACEVTDIREQYALLPWEDTQKIAEGLGIRHPIYPGTKTPTVMTSDLVLTLDGKERQSHRILCVKPFWGIDPENPRARRAMEKLLIEKTYWDLRGISWHLITEREIPLIRVRNLDMLRFSMVAEELDWLNEHMEDFLMAFNSAWTAKVSLYRVLEKVTKKLGLSQSECFALFCRSVWLRFLPVNLDKEIIHHDQPLQRLAAQGVGKC